MIIHAFIRLILYPYNMSNAITQTGFRVILFDIFDFYFVNFTDGKTDCSYG
jgi:hypothetical protein